LEDNQLAPQLLNAIHAISVRYLETDDRLRTAKCEELVGIARQQLAVDDPSISNTQTALLLSLAYFSLGHGMRCWMQLGVAIRMSQALNLQRELPLQADATLLERELARRIFRTCYVMDRLNVAGSKRPFSISNESISVRLPCDELSFQRGFPDTTPLFQHSVINNSLPFESTGSMLVDIVRILGRAIQYLQQGGVKGDSHFPWHTHSTLSEIRDELKTWASRISTLTSRASSATVDPSTAATYFLSQFIYHHIYVLIYRSFLPFTLSELDTGMGSMHKAWQTEAMNLCIQHATFISELDASRPKHAGSAAPPYLS
jgi:hypothetical protein